MKAVISGVGGQGVLFLARLLYALGTASGAKVLGSETHGMSQRGGSVLSHVKIGRYSSPVVRMGTADILFGLQAEGACAHLVYLRPGGRALFNADPGFGIDCEVASAARGRPIEICLHDAKAAAAALGFPPAANLILLAYAVKEGLLPFTRDQLASAVAAVSLGLHASRNLEVLAAALGR